MDACIGGGGRMSWGTAGSAKDTTVILQKLEAEQQGGKRYPEGQKTRHETKYPVTPKASI